MSIQAEYRFRVATALGLVHTALSGRPSAKIGGGLVPINLAGQELINATNWNWTLGSPIYLDLRQEIVLAAAAWDEPNRQLTLAGAFAGYEHVRGDYLLMEAGTGVTIAKRLEVEAKQSDDILLMVDAGLAADLALDVQATLTLDRMRLPLDFRSVDQTYATNGLVNGLVSTDMKGIIRRRALAYTTSIGNYWYAIANAQPKGDEDGPPYKTFEMWPSATSESPSFFIISYYTDWQHVTTDSTFLQIPEWIVPLYIQALMQVTLGLEEGDELSMPERMALVFNRENPTYNSALDRDIGEQDNYGPVEGGAAQQRTRNDAYLWNFGEIAAPS